MSEIWTGQVGLEAADAYEAEFAPVFAQWSPLVLDAAAVTGGHDVLDIACGTGVLARAARDRVGRLGSVVGVDIHEGMLAVGRRLAPTIDWRQGAAEALPCEDDAFDAVVSQFGLMFFDDRPAALLEMARVLRAEGRLAIAVWDSLDTIPAYSPFLDLIRVEFGDEAVAALSSPFRLGDQNELRDLVAGAGFEEVVVTTPQAPRRSVSAQAFAKAEIGKWEGASGIEEERLAEFASAAERTLSAYVAADGSFTMTLRAHVIAARAPSSR